MSTTAVSKSASDENKITGAAVGEKRGRGRPPKKVLQANNKEGSSSDNNTSSDDAAEAKKPRVEPENKHQSNSKVDASSSSVKRGRGRPPKEVKKDVASGIAAQDPRKPSIPVVKPVESAKTVIQKIASAAAALIPNIGGSGAAATPKDAVSLPTPAVAKTPQASNTTQTAKPVGTPATPASASSTPAQKGSATPAADGSAKRGRGRPPKSNSNNRPATLQNGNAEPKGASTPDLTLSSPVAEGATSSSAQKRGRGRPPKVGGVAAKKAPAAKPDGVKKGRGRPKKSAKGRGRPRKSQSTSQESSSQESEEYSSSESGEESDEKQGNSASDEGDATPAAANTTSQ